MKFTTKKKHMLITRTTQFASLIISFSKLLWEFTKIWSYLVQCWALSIGTPNVPFTSFMKRRILFRTRKTSGVILSSLLILQMWKLGSTRSSISLKYCSPREVQLPVYTDLFPEAPAFCCPNEQSLRERRAGLYIFRDHEPFASGSVFALSYFHLFFTWRIGEQWETFLIRDYVYQI